jgi:uncharacterized membrane protein
MGDASKRSKFDLGFPLHALLNAFPLGMLGAATAFDVASQFTATPCSDFPRPAFWLIALGLVAGVVSGMFGLVDLLRLSKDSVAYKVGTRHVAATDVALLLYGVSLFLRRGSDYCASVAPGPFLLSLVGGAVLVFGSALGARLTYRYGVGVKPGAAEPGTAEPGAAEPDSGGPDASTARER